MLAPQTLSPATQDRTRFSSAPCIAKGSERSSNYSAPRLTTRRENTILFARPLALSSDGRGRILAVSTPPAAPRDELSRLLFLLPVPSRRMARPISSITEFGASLKSASSKSRSLARKPWIWTHGKDIESPKLLNIMRSETAMREIAYTRHLTPTPRDPHAKATPNLKGHLGSPRGLYMGSATGTTPRSPGTVRLCALTRARASVGVLT